MNYCRNEFLRGLCLTLIRIKFVKTRDKFSSSHYPPPRRIVTLSIKMARVWFTRHLPPTKSALLAGKSLGSEVNDTTVFDVS